MKILKLKAIQNGMAKTLIKITPGQKRCTLTKMPSHYRIKREYRLGTKWLHFMALHKTFKIFSVKGMKGR